MNLLKSKKNLLLLAASVIVWLGTCLLAMHWNTVYDGAVGGPPTYLWVFAPVALGFSLFITIVSVALILLFCSMSAWYITRVRSGGANLFYYLCLFSMIVPFQMVMFTLTFTADQLKLNTPWTIPVVYLGFGAGLAIFMFVGFVKGLPLEIEEAAAIDGASRTQALFRIKLPLVMPSVTICTFLTLTNTFKMFDQNLALTGGAPEQKTELLALNIYNTFYGRNGWQGVGQAKAVVFFIIVALLAFLQLRVTGRREANDI